MWDATDGGMRREEEKTETTSSYRGNFPEAKARAISTTSVFFSHHPGERRASYAVYYGAASSSSQPSSAVTQLTAGTTYILSSSLAFRLGRSGKR